MLLPLLLGQGTAGPQAYTLSVDPASFSLTLPINALQVARQLPVTATSYSYSHPSNTLVVARQWPITATSYAISYSNNALLRTYALPITGTSLAWSPATLALLAARQWSADAASYSITAADPAFVTARTLSVTGESLSISFVNVTLDYFQSAKVLLPDATSWALTFSNPALAVTRQLPVSATSAAISTAAPAITAQRAINPAPGSYDIIAATASLTATRQWSVLFAQTTYVQAGYVESGYVGAERDYRIGTRYVTVGYVQPGYVGTDESANLSVGRALAPTASSIVVSFAPVAIGIAQTYPDPADVRAGVIYGPDGVYVGTLDLTLSEAAIEAIAAAVWAKTLPLGAAPPITYGSHTPAAGEIAALAHAVWAKSLP